MINKYNDFLLESMISESKVVYSRNFRTALSKVDDTISNKLLGIENKDIDVTSNYIDIDKSRNDMVSFTPDRRAQEILNDPTEYVRFTGNGGGWLKISDANKGIFKRLGFTPTTDTAYSPNSSEIGKVISKCNSNVTDKVYVYVKFDNGEGVFNNDKLRYLPSTDKESTIWNKYRQEMRVGRLVRALLSSNKETFSDREIELFVNNYKSTIDKLNDKFSYFDIVSGDDIFNWYNRNKYYNMYDGTLGNSCMASGNFRKLSLYTNNKNIELIIYRAPDNESKILGRAILWTLLDGKKFMDRVYYLNDSDDNLFKEFAKENGFYYKHNGYPFSPSGVQDNEIKLVSQVEKDLDRFPYVDTLSYYNVNNGLIGANSSDLGAGVIYSLHCTQGGIDSGYCTECGRGDDSDCKICHGDAYEIINELSDLYDDEYDD